MNTLEILSVKKLKNFYNVKIKNNPFYPDGKGGQLGDRGFINNIKVLKSYEDGVDITDELSPGIHSYLIDKNNRFDIAQQHTSQHLLSAILKDKFDIDTLSFHMSEEYSSIDIDLNNLNEEIITEIEQIFSNYVLESLNVEEILTDKNNISKFNLRKKISDKIEDDIRLIKIGNIDISACGGFHVKNTSELKLLKIINIEKVKGNLLRIYYLSGDRALKYFSFLHKTLKSISNDLSTSIYDSKSKIYNLLNENKELIKDLKNLKQLYSKVIGENLNNIDDDIIFFEDENNHAEFAFNYIDLTEKVFIYKYNDQISIFSENINIKDLINKLKTDYNIKGGGSKNRGNIKGDISINSIINVIKNN